jgi:hypothetical protein
MPLLIEERSERIARRFEAPVIIATPAEEQAQMSREELDYKPDGLADRLERTDAAVDDRP